MLKFFSIGEEPLIGEKYMAMMRERVINEEFFLYDNSDEFKASVINAVVSDPAWTSPKMHLAGSAASNRNTGADYQNPSPACIDVLVHNRINFDSAITKIAEVTGQEPSRIESVHLHSNCQSCSS